MAWTRKKLRRKARKAAKALRPRGRASAETRAMMERVLDELGDHPMVAKVQHVAVKGQGIEMAVDINPVLLEAAALNSPELEHLIPTPDDLMVIYDWWCPACASGCASQDVKRSEGHKPCCPLCDKAGLVDAGLLDEAERAVAETPEVLDPGGTYDVDLDA